MLHLMVDTSTWLDLAKRRNGQRWIVAIRELVRQGDLELLVPVIVLEEFARNRSRLEESMTSGITQRFKQLRRDLNDYGTDDKDEALQFLDALGHQLPLIGAMTTRNFDDIEQLLRSANPVGLDSAGRERVVDRGLRKLAPFHRNRNSVADASLIETYGIHVEASNLEEQPHAFVTSNHDDFSDVDRRQPHPDLAAFFRPGGSTYHLGFDGLDSALRGAFGDLFDELLEDSDIVEEPRRLDEILSAEQELFDRIWYDRSMLSEQKALESGATAAREDLIRVAGAARQRIEAAYGQANLGPYDKFEWGMLNGKLSALRWVLGSEWDFLDT